MPRAATARTVGAGAGFSGDRVEPALLLARSGEVDDIALECLAERTLIDALLRRRATPADGFDRHVGRRLRTLLPAAAEAGCRIISNLGAANPAGAALAITELANQIGLAALRVAAVVGDDVLERRDDVAWAEDVAGDWIGAHAYLGKDALVDALDAGADVVVGGRIADAALFAAPVADYLQGDEALAGALTVGHLMECGGQLTGGNLAAPRGDGLVAADLADLGYPAATVAADGSAEVFIPGGQPGRLDRLTCVLQLLYEVHDPSHYITPDAILDFTTVELEEVGANRVRMHGAGYRGAPERLKVTGFVARPGMTCDGEITYAGSGALQRAKVAQEVLEIRLEALGIGERRIDLVGVDSTLGPASPPAATPPPEVRVHASAFCETQELAEAVEGEIYSLTLAGPAFGAGMRMERRPTVHVVDGFVDRERVNPTVVWGDDL